MPLTYDPLTLLFHLAADSDLGMAASDAIHSPAEAGILDTPLRDAGDLTSVQVAALDLLLHETAMRTLRPNFDANRAMRRVRVAAAITGVLMPPVQTDSDGRYAATLDIDGNLPTVDDYLPDLRQAEQRLAAYRADHDRGEWVDPNAVAGAVADLHDTTRTLVAVMEVGGKPSLVEGR